VNQQLKNPSCGYYALSNIVMMMRAISASTPEEAVKILHLMRESNVPSNFFIRRWQTLLESESEFGNSGYHMKSINEAILERPHAKYLIEHAPEIRGLPIPIQIIQMDELVTPQHLDAEIAKVLSEKKTKNTQGATQFLGFLCAVHDHWVALVVAIHPTGTSNVEIIMMDSKNNSILSTLKTRNDWLANQPWANVPSPKTNDENQHESHHQNKHGAEELEEKIVDDEENLRNMRRRARYIHTRFYLSSSKTALLAACLVGITSYRVAAAEKIVHDLIHSLKSHLGTNSSFLEWHITAVAAEERLDGGNSSSLGNTKDSEKGDDDDDNDDDAGGVDGGRMKKRKANDRKDPQRAKKYRAGKRVADGIYTREWSKIFAEMPCSHEFCISHDIIMATLIQDWIHSCYPLPYLKMDVLQGLRRLTPVQICPKLVKEVRWMASFVHVLDEHLRGRLLCISQISDWRHLVHTILSLIDV